LVPWGSVATANAGRSAPLPLFFEQWGRFRSNHSTAVRLPDASSPQRAGRRRRRLVPDERRARQAATWADQKGTHPEGCGPFGTSKAANCPETSHANWWELAADSCCAFASERWPASGLMIITVSTCRCIHSIAERGFLRPVFRCPPRLAMCVSMSFATSAVRSSHARFAIGVDAFPTDVLQRF
jgi:hypothetical protein